jgi:L-threonylcarbamoyladenylate synthase
VSRVLTCNPAHPDRQIVETAVRVLGEHDAVVLPTETQYGLSIRADIPDAPEKINRIKRRISTLPVALFVKDIHMAERFCDITDQARILADRFLPGPLTLVLPIREGQDTTAAGFASPEGIGIRISSSPLVAAITSRLDFPVTATSANVSGRKTPSDLRTIRKELGEEVELYLDGGPCRGMIPSTVVRVNDGVHIIRPGIISEAEIRMALEEVV